MGLVRLRLDGIPEGFLIACSCLRKSKPAEVYNPILDYYSFTSTKPMQDIDARHDTPMIVRLRCVKLSLNIDIPLLIDQGHLHLKLAGTLPLSTALVVGTADILDPKLIEQESALWA